MIRCVTENIALVLSGGIYKEHLVKSILKRFSLESVLTKAVMKCHNQLVIVLTKETKKKEKSLLLMSYLLNLTLGCNLREVHNDQVLRRD